ncbi:MAG: hypothetical protein LBI20_03315 [Holosporales bacterium]|jgi:predicted MPP superfamily phosphohydrolase|nr:hypothetical protein [Holosporales bacterium]
MKTMQKQAIFKKLCNKTNALRFIIIVIFLTLKSFITSYREQQVLSYAPIEKTMHFIDDLKNNTNKFRFISNHLFTINKSNFEDFIKNIAPKYMPQNLSIDKDESDIGSILKDKFTIRALFWHDNYIFDFIDDIYSFNSGFAKILSIDISKIAAISTEKPVIEAEITCEVFRSK